MKFTKVRAAGPVTVMEPQKDLFGDDETFELREAIKEAFDGGNKHLVMNGPAFVELQRQVGTDVIAKRHAIKVLIGGHERAQTHAIQQRGLVEAVVGFEPIRREGGNCGQAQCVVAVVVFRSGDDRRVLQPRERIAGKIGRLNLIVEIHNDDDMLPWRRDEIDAVLTVIRHRDQ